jgi:hypothetical protein
MNERITKIVIDTLSKEGVVNRRAFDHWALSDEELEKFAELIVSECADIMDGRDENGNAKDGQYLLTQFGIDASQRYA